MDRNYYLGKMAVQREKEISRWLAEPRTARDPLSRNQARQLVLRVAFALIVFSLLAIYLI